MTPLDKIFWLRAALGALAGVIIGFFTVYTGLRGSTGVVFAVFIYILSYYLIRFKMAAEIPPKDARKMVTAGLGSFITLFLFIWILIYTLLLPTAGFA